MEDFYVKNKEGEWNIFVPFIDDFMYPKFLPFHILKDLMILDAVRDTITNKESELESLLTDRPCLNVMSYEEATKRCKNYGNDEKE